MRLDRFAKTYLENGIKTLNIFEKLVESANFFVGLELMQFIGRFVFFQATHDEVFFDKIGALKSQHSILSFNCQL